MPKAAPPQKIIGSKMPLVWRVRVLPNQNRGWEQKLLKLYFMNGIIDLILQTRNLRLGGGVKKFLQFILLRSGKTMRFLLRSSSFKSNIFQLFHDSMKKKNGFKQFHGFKS